MCGLFGVAWNQKGMTRQNKTQRAIILTILAHENESRGGHSWGLHAPTDGLVWKDVGTIKRVSLLSYLHLPMLLGHTRFATTGKVTAENAHPFTLNGVTGMHNGIVYNHDTLCRKYDRDFAVDSMHLLAHVSEGKSLSEVGSYGTLVWSKEKSTDRVHMGRWNGGQLSVCRTPFGIIWSSTQSAIDAAMHAIGVTVDAAIRIDEGTKYSVVIGDDGNPDIFFAEKGFFSCKDRETPPPVGKWWGHGKAGHSLISDHRDAPTSGLKWPKHSLYGEDSEYIGFEDELPDRDSWARDILEDGTPPLDDLDPCTPEDKRLLDRNGIELEAGDHAYFHPETGDYYVCTRSGWIRVDGEYYYGEACDEPIHRAAN